MSVAALELCLELRAITGWETADNEYVWVAYGNRTEAILKRELRRTDGTFNPEVTITPAYDLSYLVARILTKTKVKFRYEKGKYIATAPDCFRAEGDTAEDAAGKLVIKIFDQEK